MRAKLPCQIKWIAIGLVISLSLISLYPVAGKFDNPSSSPLELSYHTKSLINRIGPAIDTTDLRQSLSVESELATHWIRWMIPNMMRNPDEMIRPIPPSSELIFTLFGEWSMSPTTSTSIKDVPPKAHTRQICQVRYITPIAIDHVDNAPRDHPLECEITHLPRENELRLYLFMQTMSLTVSMTSPSLVVVLPMAYVPIDKATPLSSIPTSTTTTPLIADLLIDRIVNDTEVRADLSRFYNLTNGPNWTTQGSWNMANVSICDWLPNVITCDANRTVILTINFFPISNQLQSTQPIDINFIFSHISTLVLFSCYARNLNLVSLDLSSQSNLSWLEIGSIAMTSCVSAITPLSLPLYLPVINQNISVLTVLEIHNNCFTIMNLAQLHFLFLTNLWLEQLRTPFPLALIVDYMPALEQLEVDYCLESMTPDSQGRSGTILTSYWFENLNSLHPHLTQITISGVSQLEFDVNFPIPHSNTLSSLVISHNSQFHLSLTSNDTLRFLPSLRYLELSYLPNVLFDLTMFEFAATTSLVSLNLDSTNVRGSLTSLTNQHHLQTLLMVQSNLSGELPQDVATHWGNISVLCLSTNSLTGTMPSFANLTQLDLLKLDSNLLSGTLPPDFLLGSLDNLEALDLSNNDFYGDLPVFTANTPHLSSLILDHNQFSSRLGDLFRDSSQVQSMFPVLNQIYLQDNKLTGSIPVGLWALPQASGATVQLSQNLLTGSIPSPPQPCYFDIISLGFNFGLTGTFPQNLTAFVFSLSYTSLSGPVIVPAFSPDHSMEQLHIAFTQLTCPLDLSAHTFLQILDLQSAGFGGCELANQTEMNLNWEVIQELDLTLLRAKGCGLNSFVKSSATAILSLRSLIIDDNTISIDETSTQFRMVFQSAPELTVVSFQNCSMSGSIELFIMSIFSPLISLSKLLLASNQFTGALPVSLFADRYIQAGDALPVSIQEIDLSSNPQIVGYLPPAVPGYTSLQSIDISHTGVYGSLPESWSTFIGLERLTISNTSLKCSQSSNVSPSILTYCHTCSLPQWLTPSTLTSPSTDIQGAHCPQLSINNSPLTIVSIDEAYYSYNLCTCDAKFFGSTGVCQSCPIGCTCQGDIIQGCFPILAAAASDSPTSIVGTGSFGIPFLISCPLTVTGSILCNPNGISWPNFDSGLISSLNISGSTYDFNQLNLTTFCSVGHTSRLCSKCVEGYFASGRWCLECSSDVVHVIIILLNSLALCLLIYFTYTQLPSSDTSAIQLQLYINRLQPLTPPLPSSDSISSEMSSASFSRISRRRAESIESVSQYTRATSTSPLKLLIFHCQQLSLLLSTATSQPHVLTGFLSLVSSGSTGFSLSSLVSLECLNHLWSIQHKVWMTLLTPTIVGFACLLIYLYPHRRPSSSVDHDHSQLSHDHHLRLDSSININSNISHDGGISGDSSISLIRHEASTIVKQLNAPRSYGVCLALLYFFLFPCAQTVLSAIACTDTRQYNGSSSGVSSLYLNPLPWIACDSSWRSTILPPAIIGVLVWIIAFPILTTLLTYHLFTQIRLNHANVHLWPLCADLFTRFKPRYWYFEQILVLRRLLLVGCVSLIPSDSLYLPVILFSIIQLSALIQHQLQPYESVWLNRGELASLYLLLLNYITALVLHETSSGELNGHSLENWSIILFLLNIIFILLLIGGLFITFQTRLLQLIRQLKSCFESKSQPADLATTKLQGDDSFTNSHEVDSNPPPAASSTPPPPPPPAARMIKLNASAASTQISVSLPPARSSFQEMKLVTPSQSPPSAAHDWSPPLTMPLLD